jgi:uncharacterized protein YdeI (YjbR/CyaY-like superfamily)
MPNTPDPRIDAYIDEAEAFARPILRHLRALVHRGCPGVEETIKWHAPFFEHAGRVLCFMAAFKAHCGFGFWHREMRSSLRDRNQKAGDAMGQFGRIARLADLPDDKTMVAHIRRAAVLNETGASTPKAKTAAPRTPTDLAAGLKTNRRAAATWEKFSASHRREYITWITGAKRDETRQRRLATTLEWLAEGKPQNWKYAAR